MAKDNRERPLDVKDTPVYNSIGFNKSYEHMIASGVTGTLPFVFVRIKAGNTFNYSMVDDPVIETAYEEISEAFFDWDKRVELMKGVTTYILEQAVLFQFPMGTSYFFWQPWIKGYNGEWQVGYMQCDFPIYLWIDQDLKEEMTGQR